MVFIDWCACSYADALLRNLWRWLCSPKAALTSPALRQSVSSLMRKVLAHLVAEMRKLGATIVAADMTSIILATGKRNLTAAIGWDSRRTLDLHVFTEQGSKLVGTCDRKPDAYLDVVM